MDASLPGLAERVPPQALLGYLNFSDGRPDAKFQRALDDAYSVLSSQVAESPRDALGAWLVARAQELNKSGSAAFRDVTQATAAANIAFVDVPKAYREHHRDMLAHQSDRALFNSFVLARICEAVLSQGGPWEERDRIVAGALHKLNDYVGHRPIAGLETRAQTELYPHERLRPVPIYLQSVGAATGVYRNVVAQAIRILEQTPDEIKIAAWFNLGHMDELAFDPRAYDHGHPVNRRPNYLFGEWDPHLIDNKGHYRRFVVRQAVLDALITRMTTPSPNHASVLDPEGALLFEAAAVLAGTILMASGVCGDGPTAHDSDARLATLVPEVARYRDTFYTKLLETIGGDHGDLLRAEAKRLKQPFGGIRQHLNQELAKQRAAQLQNHELAVLLAELGFPAASRQYASRIPTTSARILSEIAIRQTAAELGAVDGRLAEAAALLPEVEDLTTRGIECGALADPWNILGYQGLYPLFQSREDSTHDHRNEELIDALMRQFHLYARLLAASASAGNARLGESLTKGVRKLAVWWDKFAAYEVSDLPRLNGGERADAALHVARALAEWNKRAKTGETGAKEDIAFWRERREGFTSPAAFAQVIEALLVQQDWRASLALLIAWLSEAASVPLEDGAASFHELSARWLEGALASAERTTIVPRFFALLAANADDLWHVPAIPGLGGRHSGDNVYESAYEGVTFKDSADDGQEGALAGGGPAPKEEFALEEAARDLEQRLAFLTAVAELWRAAAKPVQAVQTPSGKNLAGDSPAAWLETAQQWHMDLEEFVLALHDIAVPDPVGGVDDVMEYDRRRMTKDHLTDTALDTCVEIGRAIRALAAVAGGSAASPTDLAPWEEAAGEVERAVAARGSDDVRARLPDLVHAMADEPLLFVPLSEGGDPRPILRARSTLALLESLLERLPPLGLIRETYHLVRLAKSLEKNGPESGRRVSEFDRLFRIALRSVVDTLLEAANAWDKDESTETEPLVEILRKIADSFLTIWVQHSTTLRLSAIEAVMDDSEWAPFRAFVRKYGRELFTAHFLTYGNVRGLLHRGVAEWLDGLIEQGDADHRPEKLLGDIERGKLARSAAVQFLEIVLHTIAEHYEEYRDYNTTTTWSDYGENLYVLLDFLRLKAKYERYAWRMRPLVLAHEALCRKGLPDVAERWEKSIADFSRPLATELMEKLAEKEAEHAVRLRTIRDRIEERFLRPLALDRLCALVDPAAAEARAGNAVGGPAFQRLSEQLQPLADNPIGVGLDVPQWLRKLRDEVDRVRDAATVPPRPAEPVRLTFAELQRQLDDWEEPLTEPV
ncbi:MAG TPA: hypothetical protein VHR66_02085 [Gemmataceae bacterium]|jgi:hypothetical protein|nr:hypothetical protein [Gemmataceae bacterium]